MNLKDSLHGALRTQALLASAIELITWDQEVMMPKGGIQHRAAMVGELAALHHQNLTSRVLPLIREALDKRDNFSQEEVSQLEIYLKEAQPAEKLPGSLVRAFSEAAAQAQAAWVEAKTQANYALFEPHLTSLVRLSREKAEALGYEEEPYEALLHLYESSLTPRAVESLFDELKGFLIQTVQACADHPLAHADLPALSLAENAQKQLVQEVLTRIGFSPAANRIDLSAHPFCTGINPQDVRITIRIYPEDLLMALSSGLHEMGHALYEMGLPAEPLGWPQTMPASLSIHESQSRFWENHVGNTLAFWEFLWAHVLPAYNPTWLTSYTPLMLTQKANLIRPHLIRIQSDEVSYHLHILLRFELERALINGDLSSGDLPAAWNEKVRAYLGLVPPSDAQGVLQDIHWSLGSFGYFPTYSLGSFYAAQFAAAIEAAHPDYIESMQRGDFSIPLTWLRTHIHSRGRTRSSQELCQDVTGEALNPAYYQTYIRKKVAQLYEGLALPV